MLDNKYYYRYLDLLGFGIGTSVKYTKRLHDSTSYYYSKITGKGIRDDKFITIEHSNMTLDLFDLTTKKINPDMMISLYSTINNKISSFYLNHNVDIIKYNEWIIGTVTKENNSKDSIIRYYNEPIVFMPAKIHENGQFEILDNSDGQFYVKVFDKFDIWKDTLDFKKAFELYEKEIFEEN